MRISGQNLGNKTLVQELLNIGGNLEDWGKYTTQFLSSPSGRFQMHFYRNPVINKVYYDLDYKAVFEHAGNWDLEPSSTFEFNP